MTFPIVVVSTGKNATTKDRCIKSVLAQTLVYSRVAAQHVYVEAQPDEPYNGKPANFDRVVRQVAARAPDTIIVALDGDDWLAGPTALATVAAMHEAGAWVTHGSFIYAEGSPHGMGGKGFGVDYAAGHNGEPDYRRSPWRVSHLKTFRAGLYARIKPDDLMVDGDWTWSHDVAIMCPMLEMAGRDRVTFCSSVLAVYNVANSNWLSSEGHRAKEVAHGEAIFRKPRYARLPDGATP